MGQFYSAIDNLNSKEEYIIIPDEDLLTKLPNPDNNIGLTVPAFQPITGSDRIEFKDFLDRHLLILGETGSGKTYSAILPIVNALVDSKENFPFSAFIVDPKQNEIRDSIMERVKSCEQNKIIEIFKKNGSVNYKIDLFEGIRDKDFDVKIDFLFKLSAEFNKSINGYHSDWANFAKKLMINLLKIDYEIKRRLEHDKNFSIENENIKDIFSLFKNQFPDKFDFEEENNQRYFKKLGLLVDKLDQMREDFINLNILMENIGLSTIIAPLYIGMSSETFTSVQLSCMPFFNDIANNFIEELFITDPFTEESKIKKDYKNLLSIKDALIKRKIIIYSIPIKTMDAHTLAATIIKRIVFKFSFETYEERKKNGDIKIFYIADEFHRFITGDSESGEQSFLDRCRSYNVSCILATQSISSMNYGLNINTGYIDDNDYNSSLDIILNNIGTKLFFRSTDSSTQKKLKTFLPPNPYRRVDCGHVADVFTMSMLSRGECYFMATSGKWGRSKIEIN